MPCPALAATSAPDSNRLCERLCRRPRPKREAAKSAKSAVRCSLYAEAKERASGKLTHGPAN